MPLDSPDDGGFGDSPGGEPEDEQRAGPDVRPLPFGLDRLDADRDTQVGQFEWRTGFEARGVRAADATATFVLLDSNNDGFLTREEFDGAVGTGTAAADRTEAQTTAMASLTALLNTAAGGNTPAGQVATLPPHADDPKPVAGGAGATPPSDPAWQNQYGQQLRDYQAALQLWVSDFYPLYRRQWNLEHRAKIMLHGFDANAEFAADNPALVQSVRDFLDDVETWSVADPNDGPANRDTSPIRTWNGYITNVMSAVELDRAEAKLTTLAAEYQSAWDAYRRFLRAKGVIEVAGYVDQTPLSSWADGAMEFVSGNWQAGLTTIIIGSVPLVGRYAVRWVRGGRAAGAVAHAEPGLIARPSGIAAPQPGVNPLRATGGNSGVTTTSSTGFGKLAGKELAVTQKNIDEIEKHLLEFAKRHNGGVQFAENAVMLARLKEALKDGRKISGADLAFYTHELHELKNMSRLMQGGKTWDEAYDIAHNAAFEVFGNSRFSVYDPSAIRAALAKDPGSFNANWLKFWGIE